MVNQDTDRLSLVSGISQALTGPGDIKSKLKKIGKLLTGELCEGCEISLVSEGGEIQIEALAHRDPKMEEKYKCFREEFPIDSRDNFGVAEVLRSGKPQLFPSLTDKGLSQTIPDKRQVKRIKDLKIDSLMIVPLVVREKSIGAVTLVRSDKQPKFSPENLRIVEESARVTAVILENMRLVNLLEREYRRVKKIEDRVRASENKFRSIFDNSLDAMVIVDDKAYFVDANPAAERMFGYPKAKLLKKNVAKVMDRSRENFSKWKEFKQAGQMKGETKIKRADGAERVVEYSASANILPGSNLFVLRDVTRRKQEEGRKEDFIGVVSHELKTPLATIKAYAQILHKQLDKWEKEKIKTYLSKIDSNSDRLAKIVYDLLDITRIREGRLEFHDEVFNLDEFIDDILTDMKTVLGGRKISKYGDTNVEIYADRIRLGQVMTNLLKNAANYSPEGTEIIVSAERTRTGIKVGVRDYGIGVGKADRQKIFELFYRAGQAVTGTGKGMGVGLYISAEIMRQYEGKIWVEGEEGKGSTFYFELPKKRVITPYSLMT